MTSLNKAIWLNANGNLTAKDVTLTKQPENGEAVVRILFSGINPADQKHAQLGIFNTVAGYDFCGIVENTGPGFPHSKGDVIAGYTPTGIGRPTYFGTHQNRIIYPNDGLSWKVPAGVPQPDAAALTTVVRTAADALFNQLQLPLLGSPGVLSAGPLLIWAASTSVGLCAIQLARAAGAAPIIVTASTQHHEQIRRLGASACFNHKDPQVVERIKIYMRERGQSIEQVFDAVGSVPGKSVDLAASCASPGAKVVTATAHPKYPMPFAAREPTIRINIPGRGETTIPGNPEAGARAQQVLLWAVQNYGTKFSLPKVSVVEGDTAAVIEKIAAVAEGTAGFGKHVVKHPLE